MHVCDYLLACDMEMDPVQGYAFTSWEKGYGDVLCKVDWQSLRRASWLEKSAIVICDVFDEHDGRTGLDRAAHHPAATARARARARLRGAGRLRARVLRLQGELRERAARSATTSSRRSAATSRTTTSCRARRPSRWSARSADTWKRRACRSSSARASGGPGQQEINLRYCELLEMADRHVLYKNAAKEIAALARARDHVHGQVGRGDGREQHARAHEPVGRRRRDRTSSRATSRCRAARCARRRRFAGGSAGCSRTRARSRSSSRPP